MFRTYKCDTTSRSNPLTFSVYGLPRFFFEGKKIKNWIKNVSLKYWHDENGILKRRHLHVVDIFELSSGTSVCNIDIKELVDQINTTMDRELLNVRTC